MLALAAAHEFRNKVALFQVQPSLVKSKYIGESEKVLSALFKYATACRPAMIIFEEADTLISARDSSSGTHSNQLVGAILQYMSECKGVLFVATTNRPQAFDSPFRRRFQTMIYVGLPTETERFELFNHSLKKLNHWITQNDMKSLAAATKNFSCADITNLIQHATENCLRHSTESMYAVRKNEFFTPTSLFDSNAVLMSKAKILWGQNLEFKPYPVMMRHFKFALSAVKATVDMKELTQLEEFKNSLAPDFVMNPKDIKNKSDQLKVNWKSV